MRLVTYNIQFGKDATVASTSAGSPTRSGMRT